MGLVPISGSLPVSVEALHVLSELAELAFHLVDLAFHAFGIAVGVQLGCSFYGIDASFEQLTLLLGFQREPGILLDLIAKFIDLIGHALVSGLYVTFEPFDAFDQWGAGGDGRMQASHVRFEARDPSLQSFEVAHRGALILVGGTDCGSQKQGSCAKPCVCRRPAECPFSHGDVAPVGERSMIRLQSTCPAVGSCLADGPGVVRTARRRIALAA
jgi:hypothetical protein